MTRLALDAQDLRLRLGDGAGSEPRELPLAAFAAEEGVLIGAKAATRGRLQPRRYEESILSALDTAPLPVPFPPGCTRAELLHEHLKLLFEPFASRGEGCVLTVSGSMERSRVGLLLGVARAAGLPICGIADRAVVTAVASGIGGTVLHLELQRERAVLTDVSRTGDTHRRCTVVAEGAGWRVIREACLARIAELFVQRTRFDPLHVAEAEQHLANQLVAWLGELTESESVTADIPGREARIELARRDVLETLSPSYDRIRSAIRQRNPLGEPVTVLLADEAARLPALRELLAEIPNLEVVETRKDEAIRGALAGFDDIRHAGDALPLVTSLPAPGPSRAHEPGPRRAVGTASEQAALPSHVLIGTKAHPITEEPFHLGLRAPEGGRGFALTGETTGISRAHCRIQRAGDRVLVEDTSRYGTFLNEQRVQGSAELHAGDRLRLGSPGIEIALIRMEED